MTINGHSGHTNGHSGYKRGYLGPFDRAEITKIFSNPVKSANFNDRYATILDLQRKNFQVKICFFDGAKLFLTCIEEVSVATLRIYLLYCTYVITYM